MNLKFEHFDYTKNLSDQRHLFELCFPETLGTSVPKMSHYNWKFRSFPSAISTFEYAGYIGNEMAGYYAAIPYVYKVGNEETVVGMVCDVMTSPHFRGKGIFTKMGSYSTGELALEGIPFSTGFPIRQAVIPGHLKVGWKIAFKLPLYMKFLKSDALLKSKKLGLLSKIVNLCLYLYNGIAKGKISKNYSYELYDTMDQVTEYDSLVKQWMQEHVIALHKDLDFARWRYSAPERSYQFLVIKKRAEMVAFVSFRKIDKEGVPSFGILDFMILSAYKDCLGLINSVLMKEAKKQGVEAIMVMMSAHSAKDCALTKNGYLKSPFQFSFIVKNLTDKYNDDLLLKEENWHLMWVDSDDL